MPSYHAVAKSPQQMPHVDPKVVRLLLRLERAEEASHAELQHARTESVS